MGGKGLEMKKKNFYRCERCGKKIIERLPNGLWKFAFGRQRVEDDQGKEICDCVSEPVVEMLVKGSIKMKCLRRECGHYTILPFYPNSSDFQEPQST